MENYYKQLLLLKKVGFSNLKLSSCLSTGRMNVINWLNKKRKPYSKNTKLINALTEIVLQKFTGNKFSVKEIDTIIKYFLDYKFDEVMGNNSKYAHVSKRLKEKYPYCQLCGKTGCSLDPHHIVYQSEAPNHPSLHTEKNIIICCRACHEQMHSNKSFREALYYSRGLNNIFKKWK